MILYIPRRGFDRAEGGGQPVQQRVQFLRIENGRLDEQCRPSRRNQGRVVLDLLLEALRAVVRALGFDIEGIHSHGNAFTTAFKSRRTVPATWPTSLNATFT
jgi:hypothetical protein